LEHQSSDRYLPALILGAEQVLPRDSNVLEEDFVEAAIAGYLGQRPDSNSGAVHVCQQVAQAPVLRRLGIGPNEQDTHVSVMGLGGPHLLPIDEEVIALLDSLSLQRGEIRTGIGFRKPLAPDLAGGKNSRQITTLLLFAAPGHDGWARHPDADPVYHVRRVGPAEFFAVDELLQKRDAASPVFAGPADSDPSGRVHLAMPFQTLLPLPLVSLVHEAELWPAHFIFEIFLKPGSKLSPESLVFGAVVKIHLGNPL